MKTLTQAKKITLATLRAFAKRNAKRIFSKGVSDFNGMTDGVDYHKNPVWNKTEITEDMGFYRTGIQGIYTVGSSRDYFTFYDDGQYIGIEVYNCCGTSILAVKA